MSLYCVTLTLMIQSSLALRLLLTFQLNLNFVLFTVAEHPNLCFLKTFLKLILDMPRFIVNFLKQTNGFRKETH